MRRNRGRATPTAATLRALLAAGLLLMAIGLERLLSAYLVGSQAGTWSTRLAVGALCLVGGGVLVALAGSGRLRPGR
ncbi:MAG: hypothetical protein HYS36_12715 [Candidatus Rokubacteria bacterium]|nr:hypothetical protein [Candidatus Rokubacteria bacterium]